MRLLFLLLHLVRRDGRRVRRRLARPAFRIYLTDDVAGAEVGGAVKNVLAIACGVVEGRGLGQNARAALIARGVEARWLFDWGGGLVWIAVDPSGDAGAAAVRAAARTVGGHATLVRAPAEVRAAVDVFEPLPEPLMRITSGLKAAFDPAGVLNPGRMYAGV